MPFDLVALCYKESYINLLLSNEETKKKLIEYQFAEDINSGDYGEIDEDKLMKLFGGGING